MNPNQRLAQAYLVAVYQTTPDDVSEADVLAALVMAFGTLLCTVSRCDVEAAMGLANQASDRMRDVVARVCLGAGAAAGNA